MQLLQIDKGMMYLQEAKFRILHRIFYSDEGFGIFSAEPIENIDEFKLNKYGNVTIKGNLPDFQIMSEHNLEVKEENHSKYGISYNVVRVVVEKIKGTPESHQAVIKAALPQGIADALIQAYPNDLIINLFKDNLIDHNLVKGLGEKNIIKYREIVLRSIPVFEVMSKYDKYGVTFKKAEKMLDKFQTQDEIDRIFKEDIYELCQIDGFGFKTIDKIALSRGDDKTSDGRIHAFARYKLEEHEGIGHTFMALNDMIKEASKELGISKKIASEAISEDNQIKYVWIQDRIIFLEKLVEKERDIMNLLLDRVDKKSNISKDKIDEKINFLESLQGFQFTEEQREAVYLAVSNRVFILNGKAGVGKSTTLKAIVKALGDNYVSCALSGRAAQVLNAMGIKSMTMARLSGVGEGSIEKEEADGNVYDTIIIDESSMVSVRDFHHLLTQIRAETRIIFVGDSGQLSGIGAGAVFRDLIKSNMFPMKQLNKVHRQAEKSGILSEANKIRDGLNIVRRNDYGTHFKGELKDLVVKSFSKSDKSKIKDHVIDIAKKYKGRDLMDFQILTPLKQRGDLSSHELNLSLQKVFNDNYKTDEFVKVGKYEYYVGDKVIHNGNNYDTDPTVHNGTFGIVKEINKSDGMILIDFDDVGEKYYLKSDLVGDSNYGIELAYAISVHKSQGSGIKNVVMAFDYSSFKLLSRQLIYTGITRAKSGCMVLCEGESLHYAVTQDHSENRRTTLYAQLTNKFKLNNPQNRYQDNVDLAGKPF